MASESIVRAVASWQDGLIQSQGFGTVNNLLLDHAQSLVAALAAQNVPQETITSILAVFNTALQLCGALPDGIADKGDQPDEEVPSDCMFDGPNERSLDVSYTGSSLAEESCMSNAELLQRARELTGEREYCACDTDASVNVTGDILFSSQDSYELYDKFHGWEGLVGSVDAMYARLSGDPRTSRFFKGKPRHLLMRHMSAFIGTAMLGRVMYSQEDLRAKHCTMIDRQGLGPEHVDVMCEHLSEVLGDMGTDESTIKDALHILQEQKVAFQQVKEEVLAAQTAAAADVDTGSIPMAAAGACPFAHLHIGH